MSNWSDYNKALRQRGNITVWLSEEAIAKWYEAERVYDGSGTPRLYSDFVIITAVDMVIPTQANAVENEKAATQRNRNLLEIKTHGCMQWQRAQQSGRRN